MGNIKVNDGFKTFTINGDENRIIKINTTDMQLMTRIKKAEPKLTELSQKCCNIDDTLSVDDTISLMDTCETEVRKTIDYILNSKVSDIVFGNTGCISISGGEPLFVNFINAVVAEINKDIEKESKISEKKINKYTSQVKK